MAVDAGAEGVRAVLLLVVVMVFISGPCRGAAVLCWMRPIVGRHDLRPAPECRARACKTGGAVRALRMRMRMRMRMWGGWWLLMLHAFAEGGGRGVRPAAQ